MTTKIRTLVSGAPASPSRVSIYICLNDLAGERHRLREGDFDLDLSYITPRVIAFGLPSFGLEGAYRNPASEVCCVSITKQGICGFVFEQLLLFESARAWSAAGRSSLSVCFALDVCVEFCLSASYAVVLHTVCNTHDS